MSTAAPAARRLAALALACLAATGLAACGDDDANTASTTPAATTGPVSVVDHTAKTITLPKPATRVVSADWTSAEIALALGVTPVAVGDRDTYRNWVGAGPDLPSSVAAIGARYEPSLEQIAALKPGPHRAGERRAREGPRQARGDRARRRTGRLRAQQGVAEDRVGGDDRRDAQARHADRQAAEAKALLADMDTTIAAQAKRIEDAGLAGDSVVLTQTSVGGKPATRLFDDGSEMIEVVCAGSASSTASRASTRTTRSRRSASRACARSATPTGC